MSEVRYCKFCKVDHPKTTEFYVFSKEGWVKECRAKKSAADLDWRNKNSERKKQNDRLYYENNREKIINQVSIYSKKNADYKRKYWLKRWHVKYNSDMQFKMANILRSRIQILVRRGKISKTFSAVKNLGCSIEEFTNHIQSLWQPGMTWDNYGTHGWHIDHKRPLISFDLTNSNDIAAACHYLNLQPLWAFENLSKGGKYERINANS